MYYDLESNDYYMWLLGRVGISRSLFENYSRLLEVLFSTDFIYAFIMDANRAQAGLNLRSIYAMEAGVDLEDVQTGRCTVLEMFVALSDSFAEFSGREKSDCFWEMIENLGLRGCNNDNFDRNYILNRLSDWMGRCYKPDGEGSPFPLRNYNGDSRNMEIWNQMNAYILENYPVD